MLQEAKRRHDALVEAKNRQDKPSGGTTPDTTPTPDSTPDTTPPTTTPQTPQEAWNDAMGKFIRGEINRAGLQTAADAYRWALGVKSKCK